MVKCNKCGSENFVNSLGVVALTRTCRECGNTWSSLQDEVAQAPTAPEVVLEAPVSLPEESSPLEEAKAEGEDKKPAKGRGRASKKGA
jgi:transposase-like protein